VTGTVLWGVNNIFTVLTGHLQLECRIKGKVLEGKREAYNPLAPGDSVEVEVSEDDAGKGMIVRRNERKNRFARWNKKRQAPQIIAANIDCCFCVTSPEGPPFRPRFIDRVTVTAEEAGIPVTIICNKSDRRIGEQVRNRLRAFEGAGYTVLFSSALTGAGLEELAENIAGKRVLFLGQSGVGKSTLLNVLLPGSARKTADISLKHDRGKHTTVYSALIRGDGFEIIDTPGIREIELFGVRRQDLAYRFPDFAPHLGGCRFPSCRHMEEPGCGIKQAVEEGKIDPDRYESYRRMLVDIEERAEDYG
jgi:ribosome biogenesis GTPase / thiamine phosphate phosphatase